MNNGNSAIYSSEIINHTQPSNFIDQDHFLDSQNTNMNLNTEQLLNSIPQPSGEINELSEENEEQNNRKHLKRRSKREVEGRNYVCKMCSKSYLSYPALYTHYKQKHNTNNSSGRGRGRPKKENLELENEKNKFNPVNETFFSKEERTGKTEPKNQINECIDKAFNDLYDVNKKSRIDERNMKFYLNIDDHPFLGKFKNDPHEVNKSLGDEHQISDLVFIEYLNKMSTFCNPQYYAKLIKFVTLFREHVNIVNNNKVNDNKDGNDKDFTECNDAEDVPDSSNEFITEFLDPEGKHEDLGYSKEECIDLTQNLCFWMYENNFTCSKLSLIRNEK